MEKYAVYTTKLLPKSENFAPGHRACVGCGEALAVRMAFKALGDNVVVVGATGCMEIVSSPFPFTSWRVPWIHTLFENTAAVASGIEGGLKMLKKKGLIPDEDITVVAMAGDGGTSDIGMQALSGALERGHDFVYLCFDNEGYMNTGIQRSSATPYGASTTTSPAGKYSIGQTTWKKDLPGIAAAHGIPYVATACPGYPFDLINKVQKAAAVKGPAYVHIFSPCPTGWRSPTDQSVRISRLAVESGLFPLYEVEDGTYKLTFDFPELRPIDEYLKMQGRYRHLPSDEMAKIQAEVVKRYKKLKARIGK